MGAYIFDFSIDALFYVTKLKGDFDDVSNTCHITYTHLYSVDKRDNSRYNVESTSVSKNRKVRDEYMINEWSTIYEDIILPTSIIRLYFDFE